MQALAALLAGAGANATQQPQPNWLQQVAALAAGGAQSSSPSSASSLGYPGTGAFASQSPTEAAHMYAYMMQVSEQARLLAQAESQSATPAAAPRTEEDLRKKVREMLKAELADAKLQVPASKQGPEAKTADTESVPADAKAEQDLDKARREYELDRHKEGHEID